MSSTDNPWIIESGDADTGAYIKVLDIDCLDGPTFCSAVEVAAFIEDLQRASAERFPPDLGVCVSDGVTVGDSVG